GWDPRRGELWFAGETAEAVLLELDTRRRELAAEVESLATSAEQAAEHARAAAERADAAARAFAPVAHLRGVRRANPERLERLVAGAGRLAEDLRTIASRESELRHAIAGHDDRASAAERRANGRVAHGVADDAPP